MINVKNQNSTRKMVLNLPIKGKLLTFDEKTTLYAPNQSANGIFELVTGRVKVVVRQEGKEMIKKIAHPGDVIGLCALGERKTYCEEGISLCETTVNALKLSTIQQAIKEDASIAFKLNQLLLDEICAMDRRLRSMTFENAKQRVVQCILHLADKKGERVGYEHLIRHSLTHQEIASLTSTSRQTVTSVLNTLKDKGIIKFNRRRILINELSKLENYTF